MNLRNTFALGTMLTLLAISQANAQALVGAWTSGNTTAEGSAAIVFLDNGYYYQIGHAMASEAPHGFNGFERGTYTWNSATGAFTVTTLQDLNGDTGLSNINSRSDLTAAVSGDNATFTIPGNGVVVVPRVTGASPIVGGWILGNAATPDGSAVVVFLPNGYYFLANDTPSHPPNDVKGMEWGTYAWNSTTGALSAAPLVDTNGKDSGFSSASGNVTATLSADLRTLHYVDAGNDLSLTRVGAAAGAPISPVVGLWWNPNESGSGYNFDVKHGVLVATVYSYKATGEAQWYITSGPIVNNSFTGMLTKAAGGQCISCPYTGVPTSPGNDGVVTIDFSSPTSATMHLPGGRVTNIEPQPF